MSSRFRNMRVYGSDKVSILTVETMYQIPAAMALYHSTEGSTLGEKLLPFVEKYGGSDPGLLNFSGSVLSLALSNNMLNPEQLKRAVTAINQKAASCEPAERFGYFEVPFGASAPKGRIIVRHPNYERVVLAQSAKDAQTYAQIAELPARRLMREIIEISQNHGIEKCLTVGPCIETLL